MKETDELYANSKMESQGCCGANTVHGYDAVETLRSRINSQRRRAEAEGRRASQLGELEYLLDKNPEVARILELMEQVGKY